MYHCLDTRYNLNVKRRQGNGGVIYIVPGGDLATDIGAGSPRAAAFDGQSQWPGILKALPEDIASEMGDWTKLVAPSHRYSSDHT